MEEENKTKWNSDTFSENIDSSIPPAKEKFQVEHMIQKIKKIKNSKKKSAIDNIKNIEMFETLSNTSGKERFIEHMENTDVMEDTTCPDPDYEGCDRGDDNATTDDPRQILINFIERTYRYFDSWFFFIAFIISVALGSSSKTIKNELNSITKRRQSKNSTIEEKTVKQYKKTTGLDVSKYTYLPKYNDVNLVKKYVEITCSILISCYVVFHLFFLMFYKNDLYIKEGIQLKDITVETMKTKAQTNPSYSAETFFLFFFQFAWFFVEKFEKYFMVKLPQNSSIYLNATLCFIILFVALIFFFYYYPYFLKTLFINIINLNTNSRFVNIMYLVIVILFIMDLFNLFNYLPTGPIWYKWTIIIILRLIIILFISVPFAGIFLTSYFILYGFFGIFLYNSYTDNIQIFKDISKFAEDTKNQIRIGTECSPNSFFEKIMITINVIMDFIYTYVFYIAFIIMLFISLIDYSINITSFPLKNGLILITCSLILMFSSLCLNSFRLKVAGKFRA